MTENPPPATPEDVPEPAAPGHHLDPPPGEGGTPHEDESDDQPEKVEQSGSNLVPNELVGGDDQ